MALTRQQIEEKWSKDRPSKLEPIERLGGEIRVVSIPADISLELITKRNAIFAQDGLSEEDAAQQFGDWLREVVRLGAVDDDGSEMFSPGDPLLASFDLGTLAEIQRAIFRWNGLIRSEPEKNGEAG